MSTRYYDDLGLPLKAPPGLGHHPEADALLAHFAAEKGAMAAETARALLAGLPVEFEHLDLLTDLMKSALAADLKSIAVEVGDLLDKMAY